MSTDEKATIELEKPPAWAISLSEKVNTGFLAVNARLTGIETNQEIQGDTVRDLAKRMTAQEERVGKLTERQDTTSQRVREPSQHDLETQKALADEITARKALAAKVDRVDTKVDAIAEETSAQTVMLTKAAALLKDPRVIGAIVVLYTILSKWAEKHGYL